MNIEFHKLNMEGWSFPIRVSTAKALFAESEVVSKILFQDCTSCRQRNERSSAVQTIGHLEVSVSRSDNHRPAATVMLTPIRSKFCALVDEHATSMASVIEHQCKAIVSNPEESLLVFYIDQCTVELRDLSWFDVNYERGIRDLGMRDPKCK